MDSNFGNLIMHCIKSWTILETLKLEEQNKGNININIKIEKPTEPTIRL